MLFIGIVDEYGDHFEGDMILTRAQKAVVTGIAGRMGLSDPNYRWPNKTVIYEMADGHSEKQQDYIKFAMWIIGSVSCIEFKPRTTESGFISIEVCWFSL